jgi:hypothetical protein
VIDGVLSHHLNPFRSGTARFNMTLAERLGIPCVGILDPMAAAFEVPLLSFKVSELGDEEAAEIESLLDDGRTNRVFFHEYGDRELEQRMVREAEVVYCGNDEILSRVKGAASDARVLWAPGLIDDTRRFEPVEISVFSFGMAHKLRVDMFARLRRLLEASGRSYALYLSNANHETATAEDAELVFRELERIFPTGLYFTGNLSDVSVFNWLQHATYFAAFFPGGVRANNTSVASAMEHGAAVITNLDPHSPPDLVHLDNVVDLEQCDRIPTDPDLIAGLRGRARETARARSWEALTAAILEGGRGG